MPKESSKSEKSAKISKEELFIPDFFIPADEQDLEILIQNAKLKGMTIHDLEQGYLKSGSDTTQKQFAMFRTIFPVLRPPSELSFDKAIYGLDTTWDTAGGIVKSSKELRKYLAIVKCETSVRTITEHTEDWPGSFKPVREMQEATMTVKGIADRKRTAEQHLSSKRHQTEAKAEARLRTMVSMSTISTIRRTIGRQLGPEITARIEDEIASQSSISPEGGITNAFPEAEDEATPNAALVLLLQMLSHLVSDENAEWVLNHIHFTGQFGKGKFNAYTDGALRSIKNGAIMAILEVKRRERTNDMDLILMQEAAEMVGWICSGYSNLPDLNGHRLLISQDRHEIFVTFAYCDQEYHGYLDATEAKVTSKAFLNMQTYGPWDIREADDMENFAMVIVAITLIAKQAA